MEQVKQTDEEFVRGVWERAALIKDMGYYQVSMWGAITTKKLTEIEAEAWSAAAAFTRERLEEVRELREEIECVKEQQSEWAGCTGAPELLYYACWTRTLARLESILADKTSGMKAGA